jgi:hypothetical protein
MADAKIPERALGRRLQSMVNKAAESRPYLRLAASNHMVPLPNRRSGFQVPDSSHTGAGYVNGTDNSGFLR